MKQSGSIAIRSCSFEDILPVWYRELWPGRISAIEPTSAMKWLGGIDMELMKAVPTFWRAILADSVSPAGAPEILGVLSGHFGGLIESETGEERAYRTRGLWVSEAARRQGVAKLLIETAFDQAALENCPLVWTFPRESSMSFYESVGFKRIGAWIGENDPGAGEFGPNCYAIARR